MDNIIKTVSAIILAIIVAINAFGNFIGIGDIIPTEPETTAVETTVPEETTAMFTGDAEEVIAMYNEAINRAYNEKVGFSKERFTYNETITASNAFVAFTDLIYQFMNIGDENKYMMTVGKGEWESDVPHHYLRLSTLTADDIYYAVCAEKGGNYEITLSIKDGNSKATKDEKINNSPIDKCGICVGETDKSYFDHKTAPAIYSAIGGVFPSAAIEESYSGATVKCVIDSSTGNIVRLAVEYDVKCTIDIGAVGSGEVKGIVGIKYNNFIY